MKITIPAGVDSGTRLRVANEGDAGLHGIPSGDLYIYLFVQPDND
jgi:molecular chaperone DnaJ